MDRHICFFSQIGTHRAAPLTSCQVKALSHAPGVVCGPEPFWTVNLKGVTTRGRPSKVSGDATSLSKTVVVRRHTTDWGIGDLT